MVYRIRRIVESLGRDLRYGMRGLRRSPAFTAVAVLTLGLGIGANSAVFTVVNAVLIKGLPYRDADRLVHVWETEPRELSRQVSFPDFKDVRDHASSFAGVAGYAFDGFTLRSGDGSERVAGARVSSNFFSVLGVEPLLGRSFRAEEDQPLLKRSVAVISHGLWQRRFGADPSVIGRSVTLSDSPFTIIGVLPPAFHFARLGEAEVYGTLSPSQNAVERRYMHWMWAIGRLREGVSHETVGAELQAIAATRAQEDPQWHKDTGLRVVPLRDALFGAIRPIVLGLFAAVGAVLLIACANVANMLLARGMGRQREIAIRLALGASRGRIALQFLVESLLIALAGGIAGLVWAGWGVRALVAAIPANQLATLPFLKSLEVDPGVLGFTFAVCVGAGLLFGLAPATRTAARSVTESLKDGGRGASGRQRLRSVLVVSEIAIALFLVAATGLLGRSLIRLLDVNPGFETAHLATMRLALPTRLYDTSDKAIAFFDQWLARVEALPGVEGAALVDRLPLLGAGNTGTPSVVGAPGDSTAPDADLRTVSEGYFRAMGLSVASGRGFTSSDAMKAPRVVVVNQAFVEDVLKGRQALGQQIGFAFIQGTLEIVGVVGNEKVGALDGRIRPVLYFPWRQDSIAGMSAVVRTAGDPQSVLGSLSAEARSMEPDAVVTGVQTMDALIAASPAAFLRRYPLLVLSSFAGLSLVLAAIGIYGVMSLSVKERTSEIGIRMAMGAQSSDVLRLVLRQGLALALVGVGLGVAAGLAGARWLASALFETPPTDPAVFAFSACVLVAVSALACSIPAWRASRVDPLIAVRHE